MYIFIYQQLIAWNPKKWKDEYLEKHFILFLIINGNTDWTVKYVFIKSSQEYYSLLNQIKLSLED